MSSIIKSITCPHCDTCFTPDKNSIRASIICPACTTKFELDTLKIIEVETKFKKTIRKFNPSS